MGPAGLLTTIGDLYKWDQNYYTGKVGGAKFIHLMLSTSALNSAVENEYAFGNIIDNHKGFSEVLHSGELLGITYKISRFPTERFTIIYPGNGGQNKNEDVYPIAHLFLVNEKLPEIHLSKSNADPETQTSSPYFDHSYEGICQIKNKDLLIQLSLDEVTEDLIREVLDWKYQRRLLVDDNATFLLDDGEQLFIDLVSGEFKLVSVSGTETKGNKVQTVSTSTLENYVGTYHSSELSATYQIFRQNSNLVFEIGKIKVKAPVAVQNNELIFFDIWLAKSH